MNRRGFLARCAAVGVGAAAAAGATKPNVLLITADDMNWSMPGFMGGKYGLTPSLDALAARSHRFVNAMTVAPICQPSREAILTGRLPQHSGATGFTPVRTGVPTLVTLLKGVYESTGIHKLDHMRPESCFPWDTPVGGTDRNPEGFANAVRDGILRARAKKRPFLINCNINDPHRPFYGSGAPDAGMYKIGRELRAKDIEVPSVLENLPEVREEFAQYCNSVQRMDVSVGKVLAVLKAMPEAANTIVLFTSDHGMPFPFAKATVYRDGTRTPVLLQYPGMGAPRAFPELAMNTDILPTLLDLVGVAKPAGIDGESWLPLISGKGAWKREYAVTQVNTVNSGAAYPMRAIQDGRYALVFTAWADGKTQLSGLDGMSGLTFPAMRQAAAKDARIAARVKQYVSGVPLAFYDWKADPDQRVNLIGRKEHASRIAAMKQRLREYLEATGDPQGENFRKVL